MVYSYHVSVTNNLNVLKISLFEFVLFFNFVLNVAIRIEP